MDRLAKPNASYSHAARAAVFSLLLAVTGLAGLLLGPLLQA